MRLTVSTKGTNKLNAMLHSMASANENPTVLMQAVSRRILKFQKTHFAEEVDSQGMPWPDLAEATKEARRKSRGSRSPRMLQDNRILYNSMTTKATATSAVVGVPTSVKYAKVHQYGYKKRKIPQREYLYLTQEERVKLLGMITDKLVKKHLGVTTGDTE